MTMLQTLAVLRDNTPMPLPQVDLGKVPDASAAGPLANYLVCPLQPSWPSLQP